MMLHHLLYDRLAAEWAAAILILTAASPPWRSRLMDDDVDLRLAAMDLAVALAEAHPIPPKIEDVIAAAERIAAFLKGETAH